MKKIIILLSLILFLFGGISSYSQEPSPPATKGQTQPRKLKSEASTKSNIKTKNNYNISPNRTPAIDKLDTHNSNTAAKNSYKQNSDCEFGAVKDDPITRYTLWLVIFTGLLFVCNVLLWLYTRKAANAAKKSIDLAREEFIATHRPKLRVHTVFWIGDQIECTVGNIGESTATIKARSLAAKILKEPLHGILPYGESLLGEKTIECGVSITQQLPFDTEKTFDAVLPNRNEALHFFGYIDYSDSNGILRRVAFCRRYNIETQNFTVVQNEDYEYSY